MKEWHVEDAGGGCRAFSEVLVLVCEDTREKYTTLLPLTWDDGYSLEEKACIHLTGLMEQAKISKDDHIVVCSGNIFHTYHRWLNEGGYSWETGKIDGFAHELAEHLFHIQTVKAGFPPEIKLIERNYRDYYSQIEKWVAAEPERQVYWKDREVRRKPAETRYILKANGSHSRSCQHCHEKIKPYTPMVFYRYRENGRRIRKYYHPQCSPVTPLKSTLETAAFKLDATVVEGVILAARETSAGCPLCGQPLEAGTKAFYGYINDRLIAGHLACFSNRLY